MAESDKPLVEGADYYVDPDGLYVFTEAFLLKRGFCCRQGCRHCPYGYRRRTRASALCVREGKLLVVKLREPESGQVWPFPPGGEVEPDESPAATAERETWEEAGYRVRVLPETETVVRYPFRWAGIDFDATTHFFLARLVPGAAAEERPRGSVPFQESVEWMPLEQVRSAFAFHPTLQQVMDSLTNPVKISLLSKNFEEDP